MLSGIFPIDRADGTKSLNAVILVLGVGLLMFLGWVNVLIGVITMFLLLLTLISRD
jgi:hypothetical protein